MAVTFRATVDVRLDDVDVHGHVRGPALLAYADHARWACLRAAGLSPSDLLAQRIGPVNLETTVRFRHELLPGERVEITCEFEYGPGKTSRVHQELRTPDGTLIAEVSGVSGLLDLNRRRLLENPAEHWRALAPNLTPLGL